MYTYNTDPKDIKVLPIIENGRKVAEEVTFEKGRRVYILNSKGIRTGFTGQEIIHGSIGIRVEGTCYPSGEDKTVVYAYPSGNRSIYLRQDGTCLGKDEQIDYLQIVTFCHPNGNKKEEHQYDRETKIEEIYFYDENGNERNYFETYNRSKNERTCFIRKAGTNNYDASLIKSSCGQSISLEKLQNMQQIFLQQQLQNVQAR